MTRTEYNERREILRALRSKTIGLLYPSETDAAIMPFWWRNLPHSSARVNADLNVMAAYSALLMSSVSASRVMSDSFFRLEGLGAREARAFADLETVTLRLLEVVRVIRIPKTGMIEVFVIGTTPTGNYAGIKTKVVET